MEVSFVSIAEAAELSYVKDSWLGKGVRHCTSTRIGLHVSRNRDFKLTSIGEKKQIKSK